MLILLYSLVLQKKTEPEHPLLDERTKQLWDACGRQKLKFLHHWKEHMRSVPVFLS